MKNIDGSDSCGGEHCAYTAWSLAYDRMERTARGTGQHHPSWRVLYQHWDVRPEPCADCDVRAEALGEARTLGGGS